jgi:hypothetical protein
MNTTLAALDIQSLHEYSTHTISAWRLHCRNSWQSPHKIEHAISTFRKLHWRNWMENLHMNTTLRILNTTWILHWTYNLYMNTPLIQSPPEDCTEETGRAISTRNWTRNLYIQETALKKLDGKSPYENHTKEIEHAISTFRKLHIL